MRKWSVSSESVRATLTPNLRLVVDYILEEIADISLIYGYRSEAEQNSLFDLGRSQLRYPKSKHNTYPSRAVDFCPYPYPKDDLSLYSSLSYIAGAAVAFGKSQGITIRWGGDWDSDGSVIDNDFDDLFHLEEA